MRERLFSCVLLWFLSHVAVALDCASISCIDRACPELDGLAGCDTLLAGQSIVLTNTDVVNLAALESLVTLQSTATITIQNNLYLKNVTLPNLTNALAAITLQNNPLLQVVSFPNVTRNSQIVLKNNANLTTFEIPTLVQMGSVTLSNLPNLTYVDGPMVTTAGSFLLQNCPAVRWLSFPNLVSCSGFAVQSTGINGSLFLPKLQSVGVSFQVDNSPLTNITLPALKTFGVGMVLGPLSECLAVIAPNATGPGQFNFANFPKLRQVDFSSLKTSTSFYIDLTSATSLTSLDFPSLDTVNDVRMYGSGAVSLLAWPVKSLGSRFYLRLSANIQIIFPYLTTVSALSFDQFVGEWDWKLSAPNLTTIDALSLTGYFPTANNVPKILDLPKLTSVTDTISFMEVNLQNVVFPALESVSTLRFGATWDTVQNGVRNVSFPVLKNISKALNFVKHAGVVNLSAPQLRFLGSLTFDSNKFEQVLSLPALQIINGTMSIKNNPLLTTLDFPSLTTTRTIVMQNNPRLETAIAGPLSTMGNLTLQANLTSLGFFGSVTSGQRILLLDVPKVCCAHVQDLLTRLNSDYTTAVCASECDQCSLLLAPAHGSFAAPANSVGATQSATCEDGYYVQGAARTCESNGFWSGSPQSCEVCPSGAATCESDQVASSCTSGASPENGFCCDSGGVSCASLQKASCTGHNGGCEELAMDSGDASGDLQSGDGGILHDTGDVGGEVLTIPTAAPELVTASVRFSIELAMGPAGAPELTLLFLNDLAGAMNVTSDRLRIVGLNDALLMIDILPGSSAAAVSPAAAFDNLQTNLPQRATKYPALAAVLAPEAQPRVITGPIYTPAPPAGLSLVVILVIVVCVLITTTAVVWAICRKRQKNKQRIKTAAYQTRAPPSLVTQDVKTDSTTVSVEGPVAPVVVNNYVNVVQVHFPTVDEPDATDIVVEPTTVDAA